MAQALAPQMRPCLCPGLGARKPRRVLGNDARALA